MDTSPLFLLSYDTCTFDIEILPSLLIPCPPCKPSAQLIQTRWSRACTPPLPSWQLSFQYPFSGCLLVWDWWNETADMQNWQLGSVDTEPCHLQNGQDTPPLTVHGRLGEKQQWLPGTPFRDAETYTDPIVYTLLPVHRALWSEHTSEED